MGNSIVYAVKVALAVACTMAFVVAILALISLIISATTSTVLGEVIGLISVYLPFNPATVFGTISTTIVGIIAFLVARKIYTLTSDVNKQS